jgi:hypothetical protein
MQGQLARSDLERSGARIQGRKAADKIHGSDGKAVYRQRILKRRVSVDCTVNLKTQTCVQAFLRSSRTLAAWVCAAGFSLWFYNHSWQFEIRL